MKQLPFEPYTLARRDDMATSRAAAASAKHLRQTAHVQICAALKRYGPMTSRDIADRTPLEYHAVARRMGELRDARLVAAHGTARTDSGRKATVWRLT